MEHVDSNPTTPTATSTKAIFNEICRRVASFEKKCNRWAYFPVVGTGIGSGRIVAGSLQVVAGVITGIALSVFRLIVERRFQLKDWNWAAHGCANILRGSIELVPFLSPLILYPYDQTGRRMHYESERQQGRDDKNIPFEEIDPEDSSEGVTPPQQKRPIPQQDLLIDPEDSSEDVTPPQQKRPIPQQDLLREIREFKRKPSK